MHQGEDIRADPVCFSQSEREGVGEGTASLEGPTEQQSSILQVSFQVPLQPDTARTRGTVFSTGGVEHRLTTLTPEKERERERERKKEGERERIR